MRKKIFIVISLLVILVINVFGITTVKAVDEDTATAETDIIYTPGQIANNNAGWAISYPILVNLSDANTDAQSGKKVNFKLTNLKNETYNGAATVEVKIAANGNSNDDGGIQMQSLSILKNSSNISLYFANSSRSEVSVSKNSSSEALVKLTRQSQNLNAYAYLKGIENVKQGDAKVNAKVIWDIANTAVTNN